MKMIEINQPIRSYDIKKTEAPETPATEKPFLQQEMHERLDRPDVLVGSTYKIKTPLSEHAFYVTVNDYVLNEGSEYEQRRPYEVFINSKNMEHFQWIVALTRVISAVFRKGGDCTFLVAELKSVFDPQGGYFKPGGKFMPSIIAELGDVIEQHMQSIGMLKKEIDAHQQKLIFEKKQQLQAHANPSTTGELDSEQGAESSVGSNMGGNAGQDAAAYPASASLCRKCFNKSVIIMDGCATCLNCGESKCG